MKNYKCIGVLSTLQNRLFMKALETMNTMGIKSTNM